MSIGLIYWILMIIWLVYGVWDDFPERKSLGRTGLLFVLLVLAGWGIWGPPIHG